MCFGTKQRGMNIIPLNDLATERDAKKFPTHLAEASVRRKAVEG